MEHDTIAAAQMVLAPIVLGQIAGLTADPTAVARVLVGVVGVVRGTPRPG